MNVLTEKEIFIKKGRLNIYIIVLFFVLTLAVLIAALSFGASNVNIIDVIKNNRPDLPAEILFSIRLPRAVAAICAGMALSCAGLLMQGIFQNPLVSPYTLGVSNGSAFGASIAIVSRPFIFKTMPQISGYSVPVFAFIFSSLSMLMVYFISRIKKHDTKVLILSGVAIGYLFSALVSAVRYFSSIRELPELVFWTMGGLSGISWNAVFIMGTVVITSIIFMMGFAWDLNALGTGEEIALSLGVNYKKIKVFSFVLSTLMTSSAVSFTGVIGFVGLIAPHLTKMIIGSDYRYLIPASAFMGALLLLISDTAARLIIAPAELPVGVITSFVGVPFFLYLILRSRGR